MPRPFAGAACAKKKQKKCLLGNVLLGTVRYQLGTNQLSVRIQLGTCGVHVGYLLGICVVVFIIIIIISLSLSEAATTKTGTTITNSAPKEVQESKHTCTHTPTEPCCR